MSTLTDRRNHNFTMVDHELITVYQLKPGPGWLYVVIAIHCIGNTETAFPGLDRLAELAQISKPTVIEYISVLVEKKLIAVEPRKRADGGDDSNHYILLPITKGGGKESLQGGVKNFDSNNIEPSKEGSSIESDADASDSKKFGLTIGQTVWETEELTDPYRTVVHAVTVVEFTAKMVRIEFEDGRRALRKPRSVSKTEPKLERKTTELQDCILHVVKGITADTPIGKDMFRWVRSVTAELLPVYPTLTPSEFARAHRAKKASYPDYAPETPHKFVSLIKWSREHGTPSYDLSFTPETLTPEESAARARAEMPRPVGWSLREKESTA
jgi:hypothetical protein